MLYVILVFAALMLIAAVCAVVFYPAPTPDFTARAYVSDDKLRRIVSDLGKNCRNSTEKCGVGLPTRLLFRKLKTAYALLCKKSASGRKLSEYEYVLLDNYRKISEALETVSARRREFTELPHFDGLPRVYRFCELLIKYREGYVDKQTLVECVRLFNAQCPFDYSEIVCFEAALTYAVIEFIAIYASRCINSNARFDKGMRDGANERIDVDMLNSASYICGLCQSVGESFKNCLASLCRDNGFELSDRTGDFYMFAASYNVSVSAAVKMLYVMTEWLSGELIVSFSPVDEYFEAENVASYLQSTLSTKHLYLSRIARIAKSKNKSELKAASDAYSMALAQNTDISRFILVKEKGKAAMRLLIAAECAVAAVLTAGAWFLVQDLKIAAVILSVPIMLFAADRLIVFLLSRAVSKRVLPYKDIKFIDERIGANLVCSRLVASADEAKDAAFMLECVQKANPDRRFSYTLLVDLMSAKGKTAEADAEIINCLTGAVKRLNAADNRFNLLIRNRKFLPEKTVYQGWEKKRGALIDLNGLILRGETDAFCVIEGVSYAKKYVIALDSDTLLNCAAELVEIMEHPYNADKNVVSLRMRTLPKSAGATYFSRLFSGGTGLNCYTYHHNDIHSDLFGAGNYTGKGIYRVQEFDAAVSDAFPDNRIVSHDFIEGAYAGCELADETALDSYPTSFSSFNKRNQRWLRGDWQLLPWLFPRVKNRACERLRNPLSPIAKWHIFCNMLFSLVPAASLALIVTALFSGGPEMFVLLALLPAIIGVALSVTGIASDFKGFFKNVFIELFNVCILPVTVVYNLASIVITIVRLIRRRNLLEWQVFAHTAAGDMAAPILLAFGFGLVVANMFAAGSYALYVLGALFVLGVPLCSFLSESERHRVITSEFAGELALIATKTWNYFAESCVEENNFLPPDNYSELDGKGFCTRTSPTNIGMALVAAFSAKELKVIDGKKAADFIRPIIATVEKLSKWKGNLYNWYNIKTLEPLPPDYVSSVDSGNFVCCLMLASTFADGQTKAKIERIIRNTSLEALFDGERGLMRIGWSERDKRFDGHYDLAASEAAILYLTAVGLGKIPRAAWENLGSRGVKYAGETAYSWTGGMFEYLLTPVFFDYVRGTKAYIRARGAVKAQLKYAKKRRFEYWGVSESQYLAYEDNGDYRYRAFGVPFIALSEYAEGNSISPYSGLLALKFAPEKERENVEKFIENKILGKYGLYEAVEGDGVVRSFMAHHQGMNLGAICNFAADDAVVEAMRQLPAVRAAELLLSSPNTHSRAGRKKPRVSVSVAEPEPVHVGGLFARSHVGLYGNNEYKMLIDERGRGFSVMGKYNLTAKRRDSGFKVFLDAKGETFDVTGETDAEFSSSCARFRFSRNFIECGTVAGTLTTVAGETRTVRVKNKTAATLFISLRSAAEVVLDENCHDVAHREYNNMFVETFLSEGGSAAVAYRKKTGLYLAHYADADGAEYETSRANFYGRGSSLDPILGSRVNLKLEPYGEREVTFALAAARSDAELKRVLSRICARGFFARDCVKSAPRTFFDRTACEMAAVLYDGAVGSYTSDEIAGRVNTAYPTVCVEVKGERDLHRAEENFLRIKTLYEFGFKFNAVILYREIHGYIAKTETGVRAAAERVNINRFVPPDCVFNIVNEIDDPNFAAKIRRAAVDFKRENIAVKSGWNVLTKPYDNAGLDFPELALKTGKGGFTSDGSYFIDVTDAPAPKPWSNIMATEKFGTLITESGGGYTYIGNSRENKITVWSNDSAVDPSVESVILGEKNTVWSVTRSPAYAPCRYTVLHSFGYSRFSADYNGIRAELTEFIGATAVKYYSLELYNAQKSIRTLDVALALDLVLGDFIEYTAASLSGHREDNRVAVKNAINGMSCFVDCSEELDSYSFNRKSMISKCGEYVRAGGLQTIEGTSLVYSVKITLAPEQTKKIVFCLSAGDEPHPEIADEILDAAKKRYASLSPVRLSCADKSLEFLYKWLPYQVMCSRFYARTGFYQAGGAFGFRDQLQDALAVMYFDKKAARSHILDCAAHQFERGDVQHWWHPPRQGLRTHFTDDRLFLPLVAAEYVEFTSDKSILSERIPFLCDVPIERGQKSVYSSPEFTDYSEELTEHCLRAIFSTELNGDGAVLMLGGDWNDAMDEVGAKGKGVSVFGTMLLYMAVNKFLPLVNDAKIKDKLRELALKLKNAADKFWDGEWYRRAVTDGGIILGGKNSEECKIDLLTQAFAKLSGIAPTAKVEGAQYSAYSRLVDKEHGIIKLLDPPLKKTEGVGYICDYPSGVRENGGQYTHAAVWYIMSLFDTGKVNRAYELLSMINPVNHCLTEESVGIYKNEPYVISADVYSGERIGEGGWSWYTGAAAWMYKCITERLCGIKISGDVVKFNPALPDGLDKPKVTLWMGNSKIDVEIDNSVKEGEWRLNIGGITYNSDTLKLFESLNGKEIVLKRQK